MNLKEKLMEEHIEGDIEKARLRANQLIINKGNVE